jgi:hypothetical protein
MRPLIHRLIAAPAPALAGRVRDRLPGRAGMPAEPSCARSVPAGDDEGKDEQPRPVPPPKRPRTPTDPDRNEQAGMWPDLWAAHRC